MAEKVRKLLNRNEKVFKIGTALDDVGFLITRLQMPEELSGAIGCDPSFKEKYGSERIIQINKNESLGHQRFTMAHELGHYLFDYSNTGRYYDEYQLSDENSEKSTEKRDNRFAAALLMPKYFFDISFETLKALGYSYTELVDKLAYEYNVSDTAIEKRIKELNLG